ncbi:MAG: DUF362 domain-containing protein [Candidatus Latescibacteria bacterium]|jgi:uncharacterized protein (DUF362 family)|nr:DUF362 domain-containing protein [Candidatus Latescibacterota bacterium]
MHDRQLRVDRRAFLRTTSVAGIATLAYPRALLSLSPSSDASRVVIAEHDDATTGFSIKLPTVQMMVDSGVKWLADRQDVGEAWKALLPSISPSQTVAIKVNCLFPSIPTHPQVAQAVINGLTRMAFDGQMFPQNNIIIYGDRSSRMQSSGYTINSSTSGVRCIGSDTAGYSTDSYDVSGSSQRLSKVVTSMADHIINIPVLKNHGGVAGVSLSLKNHYGTCDRPSRLHGNNGDPYIPALSSLYPIKSRQRVNVLDALVGVRSGGPNGYPQFTANTIVLSKDMVATDYWGREILEDNGCTTTSYASHIDTAASVYRLGTNDPSQMDVVRLTNPTSQSSPPVEIDVDPARVRLADFDGSGKVDFSDFVEFARGFGTSEGDAGFNSKFDLDGNGSVGFNDFVQFAQLFGKSVV